MFGESLLAYQRFHKGVLLIPSSAWRGWGGTKQAATAEHPDPSRRNAMIGGGGGQGCLRATTAPEIRKMDFGDQGMETLVLRPPDVLQEADAVRIKG